MNRPARRWAETKAGHASREWRRINAATGLPGVSARASIARSMSRQVPPAAAESRFSAAGSRRDIKSTSCQDFSWWSLAAGAARPLQRVSTPPLLARSRRESSNAASTIAALGSSQGNEHGRSYGREDDDSRAYLRHRRAGGSRPAGARASNHRFPRRPQRRRRVDAGALWRCRRRGLAAAPRRAGEALAGVVSPAAKKRRGAHIDSIALVRAA